VHNNQIIVALAGNPNSGKTSLFNELVGANQKVGNWSGVTIEKYEGILKYGDYSIKFVDLPGTYSLTAYSPEEVISRNYLINEKPDVVVNVVDGTNLERNLALTIQLMVLQTNIVIALNMYDEVQKQKTKINIPLLEKLLGASVVPTSAIKLTGLKELLDHIINVYKGNIVIAKNKLTFSNKIEETISVIEFLLNSEKKLEKFPQKWLAIKLLENDKQVYSLVKEFPIWLKIEKILHNTFDDFERNGLDDPETIIVEDIYSFIRGAIKETVSYNKAKKSTITEKIDSILINRFLGLPLFFLIMWFVFQFSFQIGEYPMNWIELFFEALADVFSYIFPEGIIRSILVDGIIAGVGGVLVFLPNIILLFIALSFLEGTGYMARAAFVVDKIMHSVGLHGKSFLPMITGFGCSIPAIMATRTLKNKGDRIVTMMIIPFMSCGAKLPVYVLLVGAFFSTEIAGNILFGIYLLGIIVAIVSALLLKNTLYKGESEPFVMELPPYRLPTLKVILIQAKIKAEMYLRKAGTIILLASVIIWLASNFPINHEIDNYYKEKIIEVENNINYSTEDKSSIINKLEYTKSSMQLENSFAGKTGKLIEPIIRPLGFDWRIGVSLVTGLVAKEVVVSTLGTIYSLGETEEDSIDLRQKLQNDPNFNKATALSLMVFVLLYIPCIAAIAVFKKESNSWKIVSIYSVYALSVAWIVAFFTYRISSIFIV
jgi:ferrous iron transport protein B